MSASVLHIFMFMHTCVHTCEYKSITPLGRETETETEIQKETERGKEGGKESKVSRQHKRRPAETHCGGSNSQGDDNDTDTSLRSSTATLVPQG